MKFVAMHRIASGACLIAFAALFVASAIAAAQDDEPSVWSPPKHDEATMKAVVSGNIFAPERRPPPPPRTDPEPEPAGQQPTPEPEPQASEPETPPTPADPDDRQLLVGIAVLDGNATAFVEDRGTGLVAVIREPGTFSVGTITKIELDGVTYERDGETRVVKLRETFSGHDMLSAPPVAGGASAASPSSSTISGTDAPRSAETMSLLERMRLRREQERQPNNPSE